MKKLFKKRELISMKSFDIKYETYEKAIAPCWFHASRHT